MASFTKSECAVIALSSTATAATLSTGIDELYLSCDTDCYISFDETIPVVGGAALLLKANQVPLEIEFRGGGCTKIWAIGTSGKLYILGIR